MKNKIKYFFVLVMCCFVVSAFSQTGALSKEKDEEEFSSTVQMAMANPEYLVTPGDIYSLNYAAGTTPVSYTIAVDTTYKVRVSNLAVLDAKGKTFVELKKEVENVVTKNYPLSGVQFVLMSPATFTVVVKGEVNKTEERTAWALARLSSVLSGVYTNYSSNRFVTLRRADGTVKKCDLFLASRFGDLTQNPYLQPGDVIEIPRVEKKITISGAVERPGTYELLENENLSELISYYGSGLSNFADLSRIEITKKPTKTNSKGEKIYFDVDSLDDELVKNLVLDSYDSVNIPSYEDIQSLVFFEGAVLTEAQARAGTQSASTNKFSVSYTVGENYATFFRKYKSLFYSVSDIENAYIIRNEEVLPIDISKSLYDVTYRSDLYLEENDVIMVPFKQIVVTVLGAVKAPGRYAYIPGRTYEYYINLAGGFNEDRNMNSAVKIVDADGKKHSKDEVILPEYTITAKTNTFYYYATKYSSLITTLLTLLTTIISVKTLVGM